MADSLYTQQRTVQFRGPTNSADYNARIQENFKDFTMLYNRVRLNEEGAIEGFDRFSKDQMGIMQMILDLESRVQALEADQAFIGFSNSSQVDNDRFVGTQFEITNASKLTYDGFYGQITLPQVATSSMSKLAFIDSNSQVSLPSALSTSVIGVSTTADSSTATIDTSPPELAMARVVGRIWERNVIAPTPDIDGAQLYLYIQVPVDLFTTATSNTIMLHPYPALGCDILEIAYSTNTNPIMQDSDGYVNLPAMHVNDPNAIGWIPPGSWGNGGDKDFNAGFHCYYFDPVPITALRIKLGQRNYYQNLGQYTYSYGASLIDLRNTKFLSSGSTIIRFDAPNGQTISNVASVQPVIYNVIEAEIPDIFDYQIIYETSYNSGVYTLTPVPFSQRVWVQVNLTSTFNGGSPAVSGLYLNYPPNIVDGGTSNIFDFWQLVDGGLS